jgi:cytochrome c biogenesis protein CcmG/thiol:disulfide interchange protein DsbE
MASEAREDTVSSAVYAVAGAALILGLLLAFAWLPRLLHAHESEEVGKDAPAVKVPLVLNGEQFTEPPNLAPKDIAIDSLKGHAVILDFWATWCGPCKAEAPIVDRVASRFRDKGLVVIGIDTSDEEGQGAAWAKSHHLSYPIAFDTDNAAARAYGVESLPTLIVISKTGKIVARRMGVTDAEELERLVNQAL